MNRKQEGPYMGKRGRETQDTVTQVWQYVCAVYICYVNINTHTYSIYLENMYVHLQVYIYIQIIYIMYKYI